MEDKGAAPKTSILGLYGTKFEVEKSKPVGDSTAKKEHDKTTPPASYREKAISFNLDNVSLNPLTKTNLVKEDELTYEAPVEQARTLKQSTIVIDQSKVGATVREKANIVKGDKGHNDAHTTNGDNRKKASKSPKVDRANKRSPKSKSKSSDKSRKEKNKESEETSSSKLHSTSKTKNTETPTEGKRMSTSQSDSTLLSNSRLENRRPSLLERVQADSSYKEFFESRTVADQDGADKSFSNKTSSKKTSSFKRTPPSKAPERRESLLHKLRADRAGFLEEQGDSSAGFVLTKSGKKRQRGSPATDFAIEEKLPSEQQQVSQGIKLDPATTSALVAQILQALKTDTSMVLGGNDPPMSPPSAAVDDRSIVSETIGELRQIKKRNNSITFGKRESIRRNTMMKVEMEKQHGGVKKRKSTISQFIKERRPTANHRNSNLSPISDTEPDTPDIPQRPQRANSERRWSVKRLTGILTGRSTSANVTPILKNGETENQAGKPRSTILDMKNMQKLISQQKVKRYKEQAGTYEAPEMSPFRLQEMYKQKYPDLWSSFIRYDVDGSGKIDTNELGAYLQVELGTNISGPDVQRFIDEIDSNNDGQVSFVELSQWFDSIAGVMEMADSSLAKNVTVGTIFDYLRFQVTGIKHTLKRMSVTGTNGELNLGIGGVPNMFQKKPWYIIHPHSIFHISWDLFVSMILIITVVTLPLSMGFDDINASMSEFNLIVDTVFLTDVVKNFFTGYTDSDQIIWLEHKKIIKSYSLGWFLPDLISSLPIDDMVQTDNNSIAQSTKSLKMLRLVRMTKLLRLLRMGRVAKYLTYWRRFLEDKLKWRIHDSTIKMVKLGILLIMLAHWIGCLQFLICRVMDFPDQSWVVVSGVNKLSVGKQYAWSFYKALAQMIGIGYETPPITNLSCVDIHDEWCVIEMWVTLGCMYTGSLFYAIMISNISSIIFSMNFASRLYQEKTQQLNEYMRSKHLPPILRDKVRDYYSLRYSEGKIFNEDAIMHDLSPALQKEIMIFTSRELFLKVPFFRDSGNGFISSLATSLKPMVAFQDDIIIEEGTTGDNMFFLSKGKVQIFVEEFNDVEDKTTSKIHLSQQNLSSTESTVTVITTIGEGCFFGEVALLLPVRRTASAKSLTTTILYVLAREKLLSSLKDFPEIYQLLRDIATSRVKRVTRKLKQKQEKQSNGDAVPESAWVLDKDFQDLQAATGKDSGCTVKRVPGDGRSGSFSVVQPIPGAKYSLQPLQ